jgi:hypothetical protein
MSYLDSLLDGLMELMGKQKHKAFERRHILGYLAAILSLSSLAEKILCVHLYYWMGHAWKRSVEKHLFC